MRPWERSREPKPHDNPTSPDSTTDQIRRLNFLSAAQNWLRYAFGREVTDEEPGVADLKEAFHGGGDIEDLLVEIVTSDLFRTRRAGGQ